MDVHWVIVDENTKMQEEHQNMMVFDDFTLMVTYLAAPPKTQVSNLNASLNKGLRFCQTDYVIFYQDFIVLQRNCFADLLDMATGLKGAFVGTVTKNPPGEREDPRYLGVDCLRPAIPAEWEANVAIAPMEALYKLGGFDEDYDRGWSWDNVNVAERAAMLGYEFYVDEGNRPQLLSHEKETTIPPNGEFHATRMREIVLGTRPLKLDYL